MERGDSGEQSCGPALRWGAHLDGGRRGLPDGVIPVEDWLEAHRYLWSPNTVRGYATSLAHWWTFLEQRREAERWNEVGVPAVSGFLSWLRNGRTVEHALGPAEGMLDRAAVAQPRQEPRHRRHADLGPALGLPALLEERPPVGQRRGIAAHRVRGPQVPVRLQPVLDRYDPVW